MDIRDRIKMIVEKENLPYGTFAEMIGVQQSTFSHILNGRNKPSLDVIMKIHQGYPSINLDWLLYGNGSMTSDNSAPSHQDNHPSLFDQNPINPADTRDDSKNRREIGSEPAISAPKETVIQEIKYIERPPRKITEIRIFFDDNTYETFKSEK